METNADTRAAMASTSDYRNREVDRAYVLLDAFDGMDRDDTAESWSYAASIVGELVGMVRGEAKIADELRRQVAVLQERVMTVEIREQVLIDDVLGRKLRNQTP